MADHKLNEEQIKLVAEVLEAAFIPTPSSEQELVDNLQRKAKEIVSSWPKTPEQRF